MPMAWGDDVLSVLPGTLAARLWTRHLGAADAVVIIKIGANLRKFRAAITEAGRLSHTRSMSNMARATPRRSFRLAAKTDDHAPYFATILIPGKAGIHECAGKLADCWPWPGQRGMDHPEALGPLRMRLILSATAPISSGSLSNRGRGATKRQRAELERARHAFALG